MPEVGGNATISIYSMTEHHNLPPRIDQKIANALVSVPLFEFTAQSNTPLASFQFWPRHRELRHP